MSIQLLASAKVAKYLMSKNLDCNGTSALRSCVSFSEVNHVRAYHASYASLYSLNIVLIIPGWLFEWHGKDG